jgi:hydrogenase expression/formation protein HypC
MCLAIPGQVVELFPDQPNLAVIDVVGVRRKVDLGLLQDSLPVKGDWVLIHVGFAMSKAGAAMQEVQGYGLENTENLEES